MAGIDRDHRRRAAAGLVAIFTAALLAGCGDEAPTASTAGEMSTTATTATATAASSDAPPQTDGSGGEQKATGAGEQKDGPAANGDQAPNGPNGGGGGSGGAPQSGGGGSPNPTDSACPEGLSDAECAAIAEMANTPGTPSKPSCPKELSRAECRDVAEAIKAAEAAGVPGGGKPDCPDALSPAECQALGEAYRDSR